MGPSDKYILREDALVRTNDGIQLHFQTHWYRSLPLSCMDFSLKLNGSEVEYEKIKIEVNGKIFRKDELIDEKNEWLFVLDKAVIHFPMENPPTKGDYCQVEFGLNLYIPYILIGPQSNPLLAGVTVNKKLICQ